MIFACPSEGFSKASSPAEERSHKHGSCSNHKPFIRLRVPQTQLRSENTASSPAAGTSPRSIAAPGPRHRIPAAKRGPREWSGNPSVLERLKASPGCRRAAVSYSPLARAHPPRQASVRWPAARRGSRGGQREAGDPGDNQPKTVPLSCALLHIEIRLVT